jgi:signal peptidase II
MNVLFVGFSLFILDQLSKWVAQYFLSESVPIIPYVFHLTLVHNQGGAFGILSGQTVFFLAVGALTILLIILFRNRVRQSTRDVQWAAALVLGGALGNLIDRIRLGYVIDFLDFRVWPVFNLADSYIVIGMVLLIWQLFTERSPTRD